MFGALGRALATFRRTPVAVSPRVKLESARGVTSWMCELRGSLSIAELARSIGCSGFTVSRWLQGKTEPKLPDFLAFIEHSTLRLLDFLATLVDLEAVPCARAQWRELTLARQLAYDAPWSHAVLRALELEAYLRLPKHVPGWIAGRLGIDMGEERRCLDLLERTGQIERVRERIRTTQIRTVDTRSDPARSRELRAFWGGVAIERFAGGAEAEFAFNLFGVSSVDLERIRQLQRAYFSELRSIVTRSEPTQEVVLAVLQLLPLTAAGPRA